MDRDPIDFDEAIDLALAWPTPRLVAVDGLPVSGKSTLADRMAAATGAECIRLDDFVKPEADWHSPPVPAFPFDFIRYDEFLGAVAELARSGRCSYRAYDWESGNVEPELRTVTLDQPVIVEGVSALHPDLAPIYDLSFWVESDASTVLEASLRRGIGGWERQWRELFLPSVELYLRTEPKSRAQVIVAGRRAG